MKIVRQAHHTDIEVKRSKFISHIVPVDEHKELLATLQARHPKANHIVWAYRTRNAYGQVVENSTDDGEPKGAAGIPTLNVLRGHDLIECAILTVRYFGGIKLGIGGMARAYSDAANAVIHAADILPFVALQEHTAEILYPRQRQFEYTLKKLQIEHIRREFLSDKILYRLKATQEQIDSL